MGTLVPVIGLVQVGVQMMADRYTYLPSIGVFIIIAWGAEEIFSKMRYSKVILASGTAAALIAAVLVTRIQVGYWENTPALYERAVTVTRNNYIVFGDYGLYFCKQGRYEEGLRYLREAVRICPNYLLARQDICLALLKQGKFDEAIDCLTNALQERNDWPHTHKLYYNLGCAYEQKGDLALAEMNYRKALTLKPAYELAQRGLLSVLAKQGKITGPQTTR
jgi:Tfp pilus assembly protein PilF